MSEFVKMTKEGETIEVSPLVVKDHKRLGWKVVEEAPAAPVAPAETEEGTDAAPKRKKKSEEAKG